MEPIKPKFQLGAQTFRRSPNAPVWCNDLPDGVEIYIGGDTEPDPEAVKDAQQILTQLEQLQERALHLLKSFMKDTGDWELTWIDLGPDAQIQNCAFILAFDFEADRHPHEYFYTLFKVGFRWDKNHPGVMGQPRPVKFMVEFR